MHNTKLVNHEKLLLRSSGERANLLNPFPNETPRVHKLF
jgi:hypothetical protein